MEMSCPSIHPHFSSETIQQVLIRFNNWSSTSKLFGEFNFGPYHSKIILLQIELYNVCQKDLLKKLVPNIQTPLKSRTFISNIL